MLPINTADILADVRKEIKEKGYKPVALCFSDIAIREEQAEGHPAEYADDLEYIMNNYSHDLLMSTIWGNPLVKFLKILVRKTVRFLFVPVLLLQSEFNASTARLINRVLNVELYAASEQIVELQGRILQLEYCIEKMERQIELLQDTSYPYQEENIGQ